MTWLCSRRAPLFRTAQVSVVIQPEWNYLFVSCSTFDFNEQNVDFLSPVGEIAAVWNSFWLVCSHCASNSLLCVLTETESVHWPWAFQTEGKKLERAEGGLELQALSSMDVQSEGDMYTLTSHCWYVSAAHVTQPVVVTHSCGAHGCVGTYLSIPMSLYCSVWPSHKPAFVCSCTDCMCGGWACVSN